MRRYLLLVGFCFVLGSAFGQTEIDPESEFIYLGRHYVPHSPWWTVGWGYGYNFEEDLVEPNFLVDVHFRIKKKHYLGTGFVTSRYQFLDKNGDNLFLPHSFVRHSVNSFHAMYGWRGEKMYHNYGFFMGPSLNLGHEFMGSDPIKGDEYKLYLEPGFYASLQYTYKFYYDLGLGTTLWANINKSYQVVGLSLHVYFSTAFKRELK